MSEDLTTGIVRILTADDTTVGTGFLVTDDGLIATCAHVVEGAGAGPGDTVRVAFHATGEEREAQVEPAWWRAPDAEDVAILRLEGDLPPGVRPLPLGSSAGSKNHAFETFGFPDANPEGGLAGDGVILDEEITMEGVRLLQLRSQEVAQGMSGAPVWDVDAGCVVGMVTKTYYPDATLKFRDTAFATPTDVLVEVCPELERVLQAPITPLGKLSNVPDLPSHFLPRPEHLEPLKATVLADVEEGRPVVVTGTARKVGVQGMGGIGKSVLAAALAQDEEVQRAFPDGVVWLVLGQQPNITARQSQLARVLTGRGEVFQDAQEGKACLEELLAGKACLVILDDVWQLHHATAFDVFRRDGPSCLLITTRNAGLIHDLGACEHCLDVLTDEQALTLLAEWSGQPVGELPPEARDVARECGNLPLALAMIGAMVQRKPERPKQWKSMLHRLRTADLEKIRQQFPDYPYPDLLQAIQVSVEALEPEVKTRYLDLAVFPEDTLIPEATLVTFWALEGLDEFDVKDIIDVLVDQSLARRDELGRLMLHDLQVDYVRRQVDDLPALHARLLQAYRVRCPEGWTSGPNDGYFFEYLAYHLHRAGRDEQLAALFDGDVWMKVRFEESGYTYGGFLSDLNVAWESALEQEAVDSANGDPMTTFSQQVRYGLLQSSVVSLSSNIPPELIAQAVKRGYWTAARALALVANMAEPLQRARAYASLLGTGTLDAIRCKEAVICALDSIVTITRDEHQAYGLVALAPYLEGKQLSQAIDVAMAMSDEEYLVSASVALAPRLKDVQRDSVLAQALRAASKVRSSQKRIELLSKVIPQLQSREEVLSEALTDALGIEQALDRVEALCKLVPHLEGSQRESALDTALTTMSQLESELDYVAAVCQLMQHLDFPERDATLAKAYEMALALYGEDRVNALARLIPYLQGERRETALAETVRGIERWHGTRVHQVLVFNLALSLSRTELSSTLLEQVLQVISTVEYAGDQASPLVSILPCAEDKQQEEVVTLAVEATLAVDDLRLRAFMLNRLAPYLEGDLLKQVLQDLVGIRDEKTRSWALSMLAPDLDTAHHAILLKALPKLGNPEHRTRILMPLVKVLKGEQRRMAQAQALQSTLELPERDRFGFSPRAQPLVDLIPHLEGTQRNKAVKEAKLAANRILSTEHRVRTMVDLALLLEGEQREALLSEGLRIALRWDPHVVSQIDESLVALAPYLKREALEEALQAALTLPESDNDGITGKNHRASALIALIPHLEGRQRQGALVLALESVAKTRYEILNSDEPPSLLIQGFTMYRSEALIKLIPFLDGQALLRAIDISRSIEDEHRRARVLWALAVHLEDRAQALGVLEEALAITSRREQYLVGTVRKWAPHLGGIFLERTLDAVLKMERAKLRVQALAALIPQLEGDLLDQMLEAALESAFEIKDKTELSKVLTLLGNDRPVWVQTHASVLRPTLINLLCDAASHDRGQYIQRLVVLRSVWLPLLSPPAAWEVAKNIIDVSWEWEWQ